MVFVSVSVFDEFSVFSVFKIPTSVSVSVFENIGYLFGISVIPTHRPPLSGTAKLEHKTRQIDCYTMLQIDKYNVKLNLLIHVCPYLSCLNVITVFKFQLFLMFHQLVELLIYFRTRSF